MLSYPVLIVLLLIVLTVLLLWYVARVARKRARAQSPGAAAVSPQRSLVNLRWSFRSAVALIEANLASRWRRYRIPWIMLLGESGSGKTTLIELSGIDRAFKEASGSVQHVGVGWNYFNRGVVLDIGGEYLGTGSEGGEQSWQTLLHLIEKYRPQRPVDGVVLTISAAELLASEHSAMEELAHRADVIHRRLWQAQSRFGVRFPVYVVITQCDRIAGFSSFARALPKHMRDGMLGWSNPHDFDAGYQSDWAKQGVDSLVESVFAVQAELLAAGIRADDSDAFILFPSALGATREALRVYLDQLFRPSVYHETFFFRGVYISGDAGPVAKSEAALAAATAAEDAAAAEPAAAQPSVVPGREPVFVRDLFERKVFAEFGLARASREALATRNRTVRILRWSSGLLGLVWLGTLVVAAFQLDSKVAAYEQATHVMVTATKERTAAHANKVHLPIDWYLNNTRLLLDKMAPLGDVRLWWFSMPGSWPGISRLHDEIRSVLFRGFRDIVFNSVRKGLNFKVSELTGMQRHPVTTELQGDPTECIPLPAGTPGEAVPSTPAIEQFSEFGRLREHVQKMETYEANQATFERLRKGEAEMPDLRALLRYTWRIELPESLDRGGYQTDAMHQGYTFKESNPGDAFAKAAACAFGRQLDQIYARFLYPQNQALLLSQDVATRISALSEAAGEVERDDEPYQILLKQIESLDALLKDPRSRWFATGDHDLGPAYDELLQRVAAIAALGPGVVAQARAKAQSEIETLKENLALPSAEAVGPILRRPPEGGWGLTPELAGFESALAMLLKQRFMADAEGRRLDVRVDPGTVVRWDVKRLDEALALADEQRRYLKDNLGKFPPLLQENMRTIADHHLARRMTDLISKAESIVADAPQTGAGGTNATANANDFDRAGPQLVRLLAVLKELEADSTYEDLAGLLKRDAMRGLFAINRALNSSELYTVRDGNFSWWQGTKNPAAEAFRTPDPQALAEFLAQQFGQVEWLSKLSVPLLAVVENADIRLEPEAAQVVKRLRGIGREVEKFKSKNPKSSVAELEAFIRIDLAEIDAQNCLAKLAPKRGSARDADFFREREISLRSQLHTRCVELLSAEAMHAYAVIRESFANTLAGRFPFSQQAEPATGLGEAEPEGVVQFLRVFDQHVKTVLPLLKNDLQLSAAAANAGKFIDQVNRARPFLGPMLPADDGAPPAGYELSVDFRVNQKAEVDGNKIIDWSLAVGDRSVDLRDANRQLRWRVGMPIALTLRWAKDASTAPVDDGSIAHLSVDGKSVIYRFTDPWSLVSMLKTQAAAPVDAGSRAELRPHTLKFEFVTQPIPAAGQYRSNLPGKRARVFIRLTVTPGGKKDILSLPVFPAQAPGLSAAPAAYAPQKPGASLERPGARSGWPDAYSGMPLQAAPKSKPGVGRDARIDPKSKPGAGRDARIDRN